MKNTFDLLRLTGKIMESWDGGEIPELEKDIVLDNLRRIYIRVKFEGGQPSAIMPCDEEPQIPTASDKPHYPTVDNSAGVPAPAEIELAVSLSAPEIENEPGGIEAQYIVNSPDETEEFKENILFTEEDVPAKPKLDKKAILSLYGDDPAPVKTREITQPYNPPVSETLDAKYSSAEPHDITEPIPVLGDVLPTGGQTVGDIYSEQGTKADVASVLSSGKVDGLRKAIGINDKFLIIRNLFEGNADAYESVMSTLDGFDQLEDALIYIHENFSWNPDNDAVKLIVDLLTRKLS